MSLGSKYIIEGPLIRGTFLSRPNRFTAVIMVNGEVLRCHLRDPGRLTELLIRGREVVLRKTEGIDRKTRGEVIGIKSNGTWALVNSSLHSKIARWLIEAGHIEELRGWSIKKTEWKYGKSRIDFLLERGVKKGLLEVKGCTLVRDGVALFPDAPTERGSRHVLELMNAKREGFEASMLFLVVRGDAEKFSPNWEMDPKFSRNLKRAYEAGVNVIAYCLNFDGKALEPKKKLDVVLDQVP